MAKKLTTETFIEKARAVHGDLYDYSKVVYVNTYTKVIIIDPEFGKFEQTPSNHLQGNGNSKRSGCEKISQEVFLKKSRETHGDTYDYSKSFYKNNITKIKIIDPIFGEFYQLPTRHMNGSGHPKRKNKKNLSKGEISKKIYDKHGNKYTYYKKTWGDQLSKILIECNTHGKFKQALQNHIRGQGCPKCAKNGSSKPEQALFDLVSSHCPDAIQSDRTILDGKELDIYVPCKNLAIEYCGLYWHSEQMGKEKSYHFEKWHRCHNLGIRLLTIFEDEDPIKVENAVLSAIGIRPKGISARKLFIKELSTKNATAFLEEHHLQGSCGKKVTLGAYDDDVLVAVMAFGATSRQSKYPWELRRFCTDGRNHPGVASRLWKFFLRKYNPDSVVSMSDRRWFSGDMYSILGFEWDGEVRPDYHYVKGGERWHKSGFRKDGIKTRLPEFYDESLTEREMMQNAGYGRIWDCGKDRWVWCSQ